MNKKSFTKLLKIIIPIENFIFFLNFPFINIVNGVTCYEANQAGLVKNLADSNIIHNEHHICAIMWIANESTSINL